jgi:hypothetical protein
MRVEFVFVFFLRLFFQSFQVLLRRNGRFFRGLFLRVIRSGRCSPVEDVLEELQILCCAGRIKTSARLGLLPQLFISPDCYAFAS